MEEVWKDIEGFEGMYQISNLGRVKALARKRSFGSQTRICPEKILTLKTKKKGYKYVMLYDKPCHYVCKHVHRLVATAFIPNPNHYSDVNHKNGKKDDNTVANLEWLSRSDNQLHSVHVLGNKIGNFRRGYSHPASIPVVQYSMDGKYINEYASATEAGRVLNIKESCIRQCCYTAIGKKTKERRALSAGGFKWRYKNPPLNKN